MCYFTWLRGFCGHDKVKDLEIRINITGRRVLYMWLLLRWNKDEDLLFCNWETAQLGLDTINSSQHQFHRIPWWVSGKKIYLLIQEMQVQSFGQEDSLGRKWQSTRHPFLGKSHGQRTLIGYSPWGPKRVRHNWAAKQQQSGLHFTDSSEQNLLR